MQLLPPLAGEGARRAEGGHASERCLVFLPPPQPSPAHGGGSRALLRARGREPCSSFPRLRGKAGMGALNLRGTPGSPRARLPDSPGCRGSRTAARGIRSRAETYRARHPRSNPCAGLHRPRSQGALAGMRSRRHTAPMDIGDGNDAHQGRAAGASTTGGVRQASCRGATPLPCCISGHDASVCPGNDLRTACWRGTVDRIGKSLVRQWANDAGSASRSTTGTSIDPRLPQLVAQRAEGGARLRLPVGCEPSVFPDAAAGGGDATSRCAPSPARGGLPGCGKRFNPHRVFRGSRAVPSPRSGPSRAPALPSRR